MNAPAHAVRPKAASEPARRAASPSPSAAAPATTPRYLRPSLKLGGVNDPEEHEAEHAAGVITGGGCYQVHDPGGSMHLRAASPPAAETHTRASPAQGATHPPIRAAVAPPLLDPGASGRVRRAVAEPILDPGASGRVRRAAGPPAPGIGSDVAKQIERARSTATRPLPPAVQARLERGFGERMDNVGVHTGPAARAAARAIGARAYTEGERITLGAGESEHDVRLMAHEATHVVQNRRAAGVFRALPADSTARHAPQGEVRKTELPKSELHKSEQHKSEIHKSELRKSELRKSDAPQGQPIRRFGLDTILDKFADWANVIPGFRLFTIVIGMNPINQAPVERSGANILRGAVELIPFGGLIVKALDTYGIFEKAGAWVEEQIKTLGMVGSAIYHALMDFLDSLGLSDIIHPGDVWDRAKRIFTDPIDRLIDFFKAVGTGIIELIKDAILKPLAALASKTKAWDLLCAVLGHNPITNEPVERSADTLVGGFMKLAGQEDVWESIQKAHALQRVWAWFQKAIGDLIGFVREIPGLFIAALKSFVIQDLLDLPGALLRVAGMFADFVGKFIKWGLDAAWTLLEIVFDVVSPAALGYIKKTGAALKKILKNPLPFVGNLVKAAKLGLSNFADHIGTHLKNGLIEWLTGALTGVYLPKALSLPEIGKFALSVLGVTWMQIRGKIVKALGPTGEKIMSGLEKAADFIIALVNGGPAAAWEMVKDKLNDLKDTVIDGIKGFVESTIVKVAIPKLVAMFIPGAGFIAAIVSIYGTIKAFMEQLARIAAAVAAFIDSIVAIAEGRIGGAAAKVESALAGVIPVAIGLLAGFLGLGGIADKVMGVIKKVQAVVDKALDTAIAWIIGKAKALFAKLFGGDKKDDRSEEQKTKDKLAAIGDAEKLLPKKDFDERAVKEKLEPIKKRYRLLALTLVVDSKKDQTETVHFAASASDEIVGNQQTVLTIGTMRFLVFKAGDGVIRIVIPETDDEVVLKERATTVKKISDLMEGLSLDEPMARSLVSKLPPSDLDAVYGLLLQFSREKGEMPPDEFILQQLRNQKGTSAAYRQIPGREKRALTVHLGSEDIGGPPREPLSEFALVFFVGHGKWETRTHPETLFTEYIFLGGGRPDVNALGAIQVNDSGQVVKILKVSDKLKGGETKLIELMKSAGWVVTLSK